MRKNTLILCCAVLGAVLTACTPTVVQPTPTATGEPFVFTRENLPRLDGSTATIPLGEAICSVLLGESFLALSGAFASGPSEIAGAPEPLVEPERAVITLLAYIVVFIVLSALLLKRRDVN